MENFVDRLIAPGFTVLGGRTKTGTSWFVMDMCYCISKGIPFLGRETKKCEVLYMGLEHMQYENQRRFKMMKANPTNDLKITSMDTNTSVHNISSWNSSVLAELEKFLTQNPEIKMIAIDGFICSSKKILFSLNKLALKFGVAIVGVTHTMEGDGCDSVFDEFLCGEAMTDVATTLIHLDRPHGSIGTLTSTSRAFEGLQLEYEWGSHTNFRPTLRK